MCSYLSLFQLSYNLSRHITVLYDTVIFILLYIFSCQYNYVLMLSLIHILLRVGCPVVIAVSTNDGLGASGENIARLYQRKMCIRDRPRSSWTRAAHRWQKPSMPPRPRSSSPAAALRPTTLCVPASSVRLLLLQEAHGGGLMGILASTKRMRCWLPTSFGLGCALMLSALLHAESRLEGGDRKSVV